MAKKYTEKQLEELIEKCDDEYMANDKAIEKLWDKGRAITEKKDRYEQMLNEIKYKDFKLEIKQCYHIVSEGYGYHGIKERVIKVSSIDARCVKFTEYVLKDDDGDELFYITKKTRDKYEFIDDMLKLKAEYMTNSAAQFWVNRYILIEQIED